MREILFRGKSIDKNRRYGEWIYGKLLTNKRIIFISDEEVEQMPCFDMCDYQVEVDENTVGQCTGLKDKNGKDIFEGDFLKEYLDSKFEKGIVHEIGFEDGGFVCYFKNAYGERTCLAINDRDEGIDTERECEVIGNRWDNPELWEEEQ